MTDQRKDIYLRLIIPIVGLSVLLSFFFAQVISYSRNTPQVHLKWVSFKWLIRPVMGSVDSFYSRNLLRRNRLNLHEWYGHNEVLLNRIFQIGLARFQLFMGHNGYVIVLFNKTNRSFSGIRLSRDPRFPNIFFRADREGRFLSREPIRNLSLSGEWHKVEIRFEQDSLALRCDGNAVQSFRDPSLSAQVFGFGSGRNVVLIDDVEVYDSSGHLVIRENFRNHCTDWYALSIFLVFLVVLSGLLIVFSSDRKAGLFKILNLEICVLLILALYYGFDYYHWSGTYHYRKLRPWQRVAGEDTLESIEKARISLFSEFPFHDFCLPKYTSPFFIRVIEFLELDPPWEGRIPNLVVIRSGSQDPTGDVIPDNRDEIQSYISRFPFHDEKRILFLGSSQTRGSGATFRRDRIVNHVFDNLNRYFGQNSMIVINASESATDSHELLERCRNHLYLFRPDLVVVNLSNNDPGDTFREGLQSLTEWAELLNARMIFILEANSLEADSAHLIRNHAILKKLAEGKHIPILDLHGYLLRKDVYDSGLLWWDSVHMSSYGQRLTGDFIGEGIFKYKSLLLRSKVPDRNTSVP